MGKPAPRRIGQSASAAPTHIILFGAPTDEALATSLRKAFASARFFSDPSTLDDETADLAIGLFEAGWQPTLAAFARWAQAARTPALGVTLEGDEALIGPLALPDRAGCARCAWERMAAASAADPQAPRAPATPAATEAVSRELVHVVRAILRRGPERSPLVDHVLAVNGRSLEAALHRVIPLAHCAVCGGAAAHPRSTPRRRRLSAGDSPATVLGALAGWVDQRTGLVPGVVLEPPSDGAAGLPFIATAAPPRVLDEAGRPRQLPLGWGKGLTIAGAVLSAFGEAIERYAASLPDASRLVWARPAELEGDVLDPRELALYGEAQYAREGFPYARFDAGVRHPWVRGQWLGSHSPVWVPAVFAYLYLTLRPEQLICQGSSNGLAAAPDTDEAALRATLELVERDAFMAAWLSARAGQRVTLGAALDPALQGVLTGMEALGATVEVYALPTSACGTTILCLGLGDGDRYPGATLGLGTDLDPRLALRQAVLELGQTGPYLRRWLRSGRLAAPDSPGAVREMRQHAAYYFPHERAAAFDRLRSDEAAVTLDALAAGMPRRSLASCARALGAAGVRVALIDVTSADLALGGFHVVRAVSPQLQPIWYGHGLERQIVERVRRMGLAAEAPPIHPIW